MKNKKLYDYIYKGTTALQVGSAIVKKTGDKISLPINNFTHPDFVSADGNKNFPKNILKLKDKFKGKKCLLIGRGKSSENFDYKSYKNIIKIAVNPSEKVIKKAKPDYIVYLENNYSDFINDNIDLFKDIEVIGNSLALNCDKVDFHYGRNEVAEGLSSGNYALQITILMGFDNIELIGYDYYGNEYEDGRLQLWLTDIKKLLTELDHVKIKQLNKDSLLQEARNE